MAMKPNQKEINRTGLYNAISSWSWAAVSVWASHIRHCLIKKANWQSNARWYQSVGYISFFFVFRWVTGRIWFKKKLKLMNEWKDPQIVCLCMRVGNNRHVFFFFFFISLLCFFLQGGQRKNREETTRAVIMHVHRTHLWTQYINKYPGKLRLRLLCSPVVAIDL